MEPSRKLRITAALLVIAVIGLAQWFFGNLYEAVVTAPNWRVGFEYDALTGRSQHEAGSPIRYYVPITQLAVLALWAASFIGWSAVPPLRRWLGAASVSALAALLLTGYIVTQLNLRLFFGQKTPTVSEAGPLMQQWQWLNYSRLALVSLALTAAALALRLVYRETALRSSRQ